MDYPSGEDNNDEWFSARNHQSDWSWVLSTDSTESCGQVVKRFYSKTTGRFSTSTFKCGYLICEDCGPAIITAYEDHFFRTWQGKERIWFAMVYPAAPELLDRISQRRYRAKGEYALFVPTYGKFSDRAFLFSDSDLSGRKEPREGKWVDVPAACGLLRLALSLPGLDARPRSISMGWRMKKKSKPPSEWIHIGPVSHEVWYPALDLASDRIHRKYGVRSFQNQKPSDISDEAWIAEVKQAVAELKARRGEQDDDIVSDDPL